MGPGCHPPYWVGRTEPPAGRLAVGLTPVRGAARASAGTRGRRHRPAGASRTRGPLGVPTRIPRFPRTPGHGASQESGAQIGAASAPPADTAPGADRLTRLPGSRRPRTPSCPD